MPFDAFFDWVFNEGPRVSAMIQLDGDLPLAQRRVGFWDPTQPDLSPGRRLRVFAAAVRNTLGSGTYLALRQSSSNLLVMPDRWLTYAEAMEYVAGVPEMAAAFRGLPVRTGAVAASYYEQGASPPASQPWKPRDPELAPELQDLGDEINEDIREALFAFNDPHLYYPGVDEGIDPVPDEHVELVIWAMQRELNRELRSKDVQLGGAPLPAAPLASLPWTVQRALVERRRWRYQQWGITREVWRRGWWHLWDVPEDPDYVPRRSARLRGA